MLGAVSGRVTERLVNAQGGSVDPIFFIHIIGVMANEGHVRRFQVVQKAANRLIVNMVLEKGVDRNSIAPELAVITEKVRLVMGSECRIDYHFVDDIPLTATGKHAYVIPSTASRLLPAEHGENSKVA